MCNTSHITFVVLYNWSSPTLRSLCSIVVQWVKMHKNWLIWLVAQTLYSTSDVQTPMDLP